MEKFYTINEVASILKVSTKTVRRLEQSGQLIHHHLGAHGTKYFSEQQVARVQSVQSGDVQSVQSVQSGDVQSVQSVQSDVQSVQSDVQSVQSDVQSENTPEKDKAAHEEADTAKKNNNTSKQKSKDPAVDLPTLHFKSKKKNFSYTDWIRHRRELAEQAKPLITNLLYELGVTDLSKNFRCINPAHNDSTPSMTYYADTHCVHCHGCGFHGNIFNVYSLIYNKSINKELFDEVLAKYGLIDHTNSNIKLPKRPKITPVAPPKDAKKELVDRSTDINAAIANIHLTDYWQKRGFNLDTVQHFRMGYAPQWKHPDFNTPPSDRLILPTGDGVYSYLARDVHSNGDYKVLKVGGKVLFNLEGLNGEYIIVNEGEFDAISTWQVGFHNVVGLGGVGNKDKFVEAVTALTVKPKFIIIALDNDKPGLDAAQWIHNELDKLHIYSVIINDSFRDDKDANALLQRDSDALKIIYDKAIEQANSDYENYQFPEVATPEDDEDEDTIPIWTLSDEVLERLMYFALTEAGNGERLNEAYGQRLIHYLHDSARWLLFNGTYWQRAYDTTNSSVIYPLITMARQLRHYAASKVAEISNELTSYVTTKVTENGNTVTSTPIDQPTLEKIDKLREDEAMYNAVKGFMRSVEKRNAADNALYFAKGYPRIRITNEDLNRHKLLLNTPSGVIDLETGKLLQHDSNLLMTQCTNAIYVPNYHNELVEATIRQILPDDETRESFLRFLGYAITGLIKEEKAAFLNGAGRNGKGTLMKLLSYVLATYAITIPIDLLLMSSYFNDGNAPSPELAKLEFIRVAFADEIPPNRHLDVSKYKQLTGGDPFTARELRRDPRMINDPMFKLFISGNHLPAIDDINDIAFKERTLIFPFTQQFTGDRCNPNLKEMLLTSDCQSGFLTLIVDYCIKYLKFGLLKSTAMNQASADFLASNDAIGNFIEENCQRDPNLYIPRASFLKRIKASGSVPNMTDNTIVDAVKKIDSIDYRRGGASGAYSFFGIGWKDEHQEYLDSLADS